MSHSINDYDFDLPEELIAQTPAEPRDSSRLMIVDRASGSIEHRYFTDFPKFFGPKDLLVANNTRVIAARLLGRRILTLGKGREQHQETGGKLEYLLLENHGEGRWEGLIQTRGKLEPGLEFEIPHREDPTKRLTGRLVSWEDGRVLSSAGTVLAEFSSSPLEEGFGWIPLPPYIAAGSEEEQLKYEQEARERYQTVYASEPGSAAAPTAGLHFTDRVRDGLSSNGARWQELTLHVGIGTFRPVKTEDIREHEMHREKFWISDELVGAVTEAKSSQGRVTAVGTTSVRGLEGGWDSAAGELTPGPGSTDIFFYPDGRRFEVVDRLLTNFHLPKSTLIMLVSAFASSELIRKAYREAVEKRYRFFSYGDAMLIL